MLTAGEITKGQIVTIYNWHQTHQEVHSLFGGSQMRENTALCGDPMEVLAVGLPYVKVKHPNHNTIVLDTRKMSLMELPKEFMEVN